MRELGLFQPFGGGADLDGGEAVVEVELLGEHRAQRLVVVDQQDFLAAIVHGHAAATCRRPLHIYIWYAVVAKAVHFGKTPPDVLKETSP